MFENVVNPVPGRGVGGVACVICFMEAIAERDPRATPFALHYRGQAFFQTMQNKPRLFYHGRRHLSLLG